MQIKRLSLLLMSLAIAIAGCTTESNFPEATGEGNVRAINAIKGSPAIVFMIEEQTLDAVDYKAASEFDDWDDLSYRFNFEVALPGEPGRRRVASQTVQLVADREFTFVITGNVTSPTITVVEDDERTWDESATDFEARFMHLAPSLGPVDVYFQADGVPPALGEEAASLSNGEIDAGTDFAEGEYVMTITTAGDPNDVLFESTVSPLGPRISWIIAIFDSDENDIHPITVRGLPPTGPSIPFVDRSALPEVRFVQAAIDLPLADIYEDEMLTTLLVEDHAFGDLSAPQQIATGTPQLTYTPANDTGSTLFSTDFIATIGTRADFFAVGQSGDHRGFGAFAERRSVSTEARFRFLNVSANHEFVDIYIVAAGETIDDAFPTREGLPFPSASVTLGFVAGDYDIYVTPQDEKTILDGPYSVSIALGDVVSLMVFDTVDPATAEIRLLPP